MLPIPGTSSVAHLEENCSAVDVELSDDVLEFPEDQRAQLPADFQETGRFESGETTCVIDGEERTGQTPSTSGEFTSSRQWYSVSCEERLPMADAAKGIWPLE